VELVATLRYEGPLTASELAGFTDVLERRPVLSLALEPLNASQVAELIAGITGTRPSPELAAAVHRRSGGIPLSGCATVTERHAGFVRRSGASVSDPDQPLVTNATTA
jgi:hypothetical protein